ncbi:MAG: antitoxin [Nitrospirae bacterium CG_4_10_14_3_um_filter_53_41]|nr:MAG: antitoxin [Nitrospirae bacterium CG17_big_fil_post_rev_8_21_14_2_50_50_9]PIX84609.1 MAG: antitoxin [Nitrospirae bacterium CG_4_10_14_3_um_filter_53_41]
MDAASVIDILGGTKVLEKKILTRLDMVELGGTGLPKKALLNLAKYLGISTGRMADLLPISERTLQRYAPKKHFDRIVSEQILRIAEVAARGTNVFGDKAKFIKWLESESKALGDKTPVSLLVSSFGVEMVLDELGRIEHGVFS